MKHFSELFKRLETSNKTTNKLNALVHYFKNAQKKDKLHTLALFTGKRKRRAVNTKLLKQWAMEITQLPEWLFLESYSRVGDLGETIALLLPQPTAKIDKPLHQWIAEIADLATKDEAVKKNYITESWSGLDFHERFLFNKLIGGSFRVGVSSKMLVNAIAKYAEIDTSVIMHSIMGNWSIEDVEFEQLIRGAYITADNSKPYPFCLAYPMPGMVEELGDVNDWQAEYKWDGIRGQIVKRNGEVHIWSRGEELVTAQFPELEQATSLLKNDLVIDGEILVVRDGVVQNFNELQQRLNRKNVSKKMLEEVPIHFYAYDIMEFEGEDIRDKELQERRKILEGVFKKKQKQFHLPKLLPTRNWSTLKKLREQSREVNSEGLMLKQKKSKYHVGRKRGDWWKWKVDPLTLDGVLIYAQKGSGRRSAHYTDFTFAIQDGDKLVTFAKAYSGLTDKEIIEINKFIRKNGLEKFGPVRTVKPELVFEIAFEGIGYSKRHKAGIAVRFPRVARWRKDKTVKDIDTVETAKALIH